MHGWVWGGDVTLACLTWYLVAKIEMVRLILAIGF